MIAVGKIRFDAWQNFISKSQNPFVLFICAFLIVFLSTPLFRKLAVQFHPDKNPGDKKGRDKISHNIGPSPDIKKKPGQPS